MNYAAGQREIAGIQLPEGLPERARLPKAILTPTTKLEEHDRNISREDAIKEGLIEEALFDRIAGLSFELFQRGTEVAADRGLILVDTKYEFGVLDDEVVLIDEVHTLTARGSGTPTHTKNCLPTEKDQRALDKEPLREWFVERGSRRRRSAASPRRCPDRDRLAIHRTRGRDHSPAVRADACHRP